MISKIRHPSISVRLRIRHPVLLSNPSVDHSGNSASTAQVSLMSCKRSQRSKSEAWLKINTYPKYSANLSGSWYIKRADKPQKRLAFV